jgi:hypothetical protein
MDSFSPRIERGGPGEAQRNRGDSGGKGRAGGLEAGEARSERIRGMGANGEAPAARESLRAFSRDECGGKGGCDRHYQSEDCADMLSSGTV